MTAGGCSAKFVVHQPAQIKRVCSVTLLSIGTKAGQREYAELYFPRFREAFVKRFKGRIRLREYAAAAKGYTWEDAAAIGRKLGVDAVVGILIDDASRPPRRMQILKVVKSSNGRLLARQNRLMPPREHYTFSSETKGLYRVLQCSKGK